MKFLSLIITFLTLTAASATIVPVKGDRVRTSQSENPSDQTKTTSIDCDPSENTCFSVNVPDPPADDSTRFAFNPNVVPMNTTVPVNATISILSNDGTILANGMCIEYSKTQNAAQTVNHNFTFPL